jgi:excisionase family DNA binding protein
MDSENRLLRISEVADRLRLKHATVRKLANTGAIESVKLGSRAVRIPSAALEKFIRDRTRRVASA